MPTYDYKCENCGHTFEKFESMTAGPARKCPRCKKMQLNRLIGAGAGIIFKGSGFYETDYRSESYKEGAKNAKPKTETETKTETKTENKTDTKAAKEKPEKKSSDEPKKPTKK